MPKWGKPKGTKSNRLPLVCLKYFTWELFIIYCLTVAYKVTSNNHTCSRDVYSHLYPPPKNFFGAYPPPWRFCRRLARLATRQAAPSLVVDVWGLYLNLLWNSTPALEDPVDCWDGWMTAGPVAEIFLKLNLKILIFSCRCSQRQL